MSWERVIGQRRVKDLLKKAIESRQVAHAYLFYGEEGIGKDALAMEFAKALNCRGTGPPPCDRCQSCTKAERLQHPNIKLICALPVGKNEKTGDDPVDVLTEDQVRTVQEEFAKKARDPYYLLSVPKANLIKVNSVREIRREASLSRFEEGRKVFLISQADMMNIEASNSLLKTLEEPPAHTVLILTTSHLERLLPTIISRCQVLRCDLLSEEEISEHLARAGGVDRTAALVAARLANGSYSVARELLSEDLAETRKEAIQFVRLALGTSRIALLNEVERVASLDRQKAERWLRLLQGWFHEAIGLREGRGRELMNVEYSEELKRFLQRFPDADLLRASEEIERSVALVGKNVYLPLVFTALAITLKRCVTSKPVESLEKNYRV